MPDLPTEIWTVIAKLIKREPPPAGQQANWETELHQQDLVSLQRVDKVSLQCRIVRGSIQGSGRLRAT